MDGRQMVRQGDLLLRWAGAIPPGARPVEAEGERLVLAHGETTGHHHTVAAAEAELVEATAGVFLRVAARTWLEHQEHAPIVLEPGVYRVIRQREYRPRELPRPVTD